MVEYKWYIYSTVPLPPYSIIHAMLCYIGRLTEVALLYDYTRNTSINISIPIGIPNALWVD